MLKQYLKFNLYDRNVGGISAFELKNLSPKLRKSYIPLRDEFERIYREAVQETMSAGKMRQGDVQVHPSLILGMVNSVNRWFKPNSHLSIEEVGDEFCKLIFCDKSSQDKE